MQHGLHNFLCLLDGSRGRIGYHITRSRTCWVKKWHNGGVAMTETVHKACISCSCFFNSLISSRALKSSFSSEMSFPIWWKGVVRTVLLSLLSESESTPKCRSSITDTPSRSINVIGTESSWLIGQEQTKFGDGMRYSLPVYLICPLLRLKVKTATESLSWLATIRYWPLLSNWKWRGVSPRVWKYPTAWSFPLSRPLDLTRKMAIDSCPRFETSTKRPDLWTQIRPQVLRWVG